MRYRTALAAALIGFLFASCSSFTSDGEEELVGSWKWLSTTGGLIGETISPDSTGYSERLLRFRPANTFEMYHAATLFRSGSYSLGQEEEETVVRYESGENPELFPQRVEFTEGGELVLSDLCFDCYISTYRRSE